MQTTITSAPTGATLNTTEQNPFVGVKIPAFGQETSEFHNGPYGWRTLRDRGITNVQMNFVDDRGNASAFDRTISILQAGGPVRLEPYFGADGLAVQYDWITASTHSNLAEQLP